MGSVQMRAWSPVWVSVEASCFRMVFRTGVVRVLGWDCGQGDCWGETCGCWSVWDAGVMLIGRFCCWLGVWARYNLGNGVSGFLGVVWAITALTERRANENMIRWVGFMGIVFGAFGGRELAGSVNGNSAFFGGDLPSPFLSFYL